MDIIDLTPFDTTTTDTCKMSLVNKNSCDLIKEGDFANVWVQFSEIVPTEKDTDTRYTKTNEGEYAVYTPTDTVRVYSMVNGNTCKDFIETHFLGKRRVYTLSKLIQLKQEPDVYIIVLDEIDAFFPLHYYFKVQKSNTNIWLHTNLTSDNNYKVLTYKTSESCGKPIQFIKRRSFRGTVSNVTKNTFLEKLNRNLVDYQELTEEDELTKRRKEIKEELGLGKKRTSLRRRKQTQTQKQARVKRRYKKCSNKKH